MAIETGLPVGDLLDLDEDMLATIATVHAERWTRTEDILGLLIQSVDRGNRLLEVIAGFKRSARSKPIDLPRPKVKRKRRVADSNDLRALAQQFGGVVEGVSHA